MGGMGHATYVRYITEKAQSSSSAGLVPWITLISTQTLVLHYLLKTSGDSTAG